MILVVLNLLKRSCVVLIVADLHLTDKEADRYRFRIFTKIFELFEETGDKNLLILGDLTDSKDHHSANLVNSIVKRLIDLTSHGMEIFILKGNHDYIDPDLPYFEFLNHLEYVTFITHPKAMILGGLNCLFLPHSRNPIEEWAENRLVQKYKKKAQFVFMHESVIGSATSNGYDMKQGLPPSYFKQFRGEVYSGDIHCPQIVGPVTYVGTPYSIRFNDHYKGRAIRIAVNGKGPYVKIDLIPMNIMGRWTFTISSVKQLKITPANPGDQVKIRYELADEAQGDWENIEKRIRTVCKKQKLVLTHLQIIRPEKFPLRRKKNKQKALESARPQEVVTRFSKQKGIATSKRAAGLRIVED